MIALATPIVMYALETKAGVLVIAPEGAGWTLTFNGVWLGAYGSPQDAAHAVGIVHMGLLVGELFDLDDLAEDCARDGRYEFLLSAQPLPFTGAVGSPVNPIALK